MKKYSLYDAARYLCIEPSTLRAYRINGKIKAEKTGRDEYLFGTDELRRYRSKVISSQGCKMFSLIDPSETERRFDARYGKGKYEALLKLFSDQKITDVVISRKYNVTRENVRLWRRAIFPEQERTGHQRSFNRTMEKNLKDVRNDRMYRMLISVLPKSIEEKNVIPVASGTMGTRFRNTLFVVKGKRILLRKATRYYNEMYSSKLYHIRTPREDCDVVLYFADKDYLLLPKEMLPPKITVFLDSRGSKYYKYKNTFRALKN